MQTTKKQPFEYAGQSTLTAAEFRFLMRRFKWTIRDLAAVAGVTHKRVRFLRANGIALGVDAFNQTRRQVDLNVWSWSMFLGRRINGAPTPAPAVEYAA